MRVAVTPLSPLLAKYFPLLLTCVSDITLFFHVLILHSYLELCVVFPVCFVYNAVANVEQLTVAKPYGQIRLCISRLLYPSLQTPTVTQTPPFCLLQYQIL